MMKIDIVFVSLQLLDKRRGTALFDSISPSFLSRISYIDWNLWELGIYCSNLMYLYLWEELQGVLVISLKSIHSLVNFTFGKVNITRVLPTFKEYTGNIEKKMQETKCCINTV